MNKQATWTVILIVLVLIAGAGGYRWAGRMGHSQGQTVDTEAANAYVEHAHLHMIPGYTCAMHPQVKSDKPGNCPICGMKLIKIKDTKASTSNERKILYWVDPMRPEQHFDKPGKSPFMDMQLVPKYADAAESGTVTIDPRVTQNLGIRIVAVEKGRFAPQLTATGAVQANEQAIAVVQSRAAGWLERLHVRSVNEPVKRGQLLAEVYAPDLLAAQQEFLLAKRMAETNSDDASLMSAARERLALLGLTNSQITQLEKTGEATRRVAIYSPISGIVAELGVREGVQVSPGMTLFNLVDLAKVWVLAEIPESQIGGIAAGIPVQAQVAALPGEVFQGQVDFVYPELMNETRTLKVRVVLDNPGLHLKPGMYATVSLASQTPQDALLVPSEAIIRTGTRTVVVEAVDGGRFRPVPVTTGGESEGKTVIMSGLTEGQRVVESGQFLIDSEANLRSALGRISQTEAEVQPMERAGSSRYYNGPASVEDAKMSPSGEQR